MGMRWVWVLAMVAFGCQVAMAQEAWPQFRGMHAAGVAQKQNLPTSWSIETGENIAWKVPIPGLSHASPITWDHQIFLVTAVSSKGDHEFKHGLYGDGTASEDLSQQTWQVLALDLGTGKTLWTQIAHQGPPQSKRHIKATYANATPATDGKVIVAMFGSEGIYGFDLHGNKLWGKSLGDLNVGAYNAPEYEWGHASSPIIHEGKVFVQCDTSEKDFLVALNSQTGEEMWRTERDELPSWGTPTWIPGSPNEIVTNGSNFIASYQADNGRELWRLGGSSQITAPTPIFTESLILVTSGRRPEKPIFAIKRGSRGDLSLSEGATSSEAIAWSSTGRGPYMPTPLILDGLLYSVNNNGVFDCYEVETGKEVYRERMPHGGGGFSASPVAADGVLYLPSEDGEVFVVQAGKTFQIIASPTVGERLMATPAIAKGTLLIRGHQHLFAMRKGN